MIEVEYRCAKKGVHSAGLGLSLYSRSVLCLQQLLPSPHAHHGTTTNHIHQHTSIYKLLSSTAPQISVRAPSAFDQSAHPNPRLLNGSPTTHAIIAHAHMDGRPQWPTTLTTSLRPSTATQITMPIAATSPRPSRSTTKSSCASGSRSVAHRKFYLGRRS